MVRLEEFEDYPKIDRIMLASEEAKFELYEGRKWIPGRFDANIGIDQPTHGVGQTHAHVYGRKDKKIVAIVNFDGTASHGAKGRLHKDDADALRDRGFDIPQDNIVEWVELDEQPHLLID